MKYQCVTCKTIAIIKAYKKQHKDESYSCPLCGDMMIYKANKKPRQNRGSLGSDINTIYNIIG